MQGTRQFDFKKVGIATMLLSLIEGITLLIGYNHRIYHTYSPIHNVSDLFILFLCTVILSLINLLINSLCCKVIDSDTDALSAFLFSDFRRLFVMVFFTLFFIWLIYFVSAFPGGAWYDIKNQICQFMGAETLTKANPILQTFMSGIAFKMGVVLGKAEIGIALYIIFQMIISDLIISYSVVGLCRIMQSKWTVIFAVICYGINPVTPLYIINMGKDTNFGFQVLLAVICYMNISYNKSVGKKDGILFALSLILMSLFRNAGIFLAVLFAIVLIIVSKEKKTIAAIGAVSIGFVLLFQTVTTASMNIDEKVNETENMSIPLLVMGGYVNSYYGDLSQEEIDIISKALDLDLVLNEYDIEMSDNLKVSFAENNPSKEEKKAFYDLLLRLIIRHPGKLFEVLIGKSYGYFDPMTGEIKKPFTIIGLGPISGYIREMLGIEIQNAFDITKLQSVVDVFKDAPVIGILSHCGFYMWILLFALCMMSVYKVNQLLAVPMIGFVIGLVASPVNAYFRYCFPLVIIGPFLILMVYSINRRC